MDESVGSVDIHAVVTAVADGIVIIGGIGVDLLPFIERRKISDRRKERGRVPLRLRRYIYFGIGIGIGTGKNEKMVMKLRILRVTPTNILCVIYNTYPTHRLHQDCTTTLFIIRRL